MAAQKVYQIQINGLTESVKAVDALNESLKTLESRIKALDGKSVSVGSKSSGGGSKSSALTEEAKLEQQIQKIDEKRVAYSKEIYQNYLAAKDVLKEVENDQKSLAATERLQAKAYSNTIQGMKQELADIKSSMQTVDLGDSDQLDKMTKRANELNEALKKIEESYGQFGRNVGNYKSAADGFKGLVVEVGGVAKEFESAKKALKELKAEMQTLSTKKDMGLISEEEAKRLKDLIPVVSQLQSSIQDAGKPMDALLDTMQSFVAIVQTTKGISAFFGIDSSEVEKTIKNLVALQNAMQGLQTIQKQIQERQGVGAWIAPFTVQIDKATAKLLAFNTALLGTGKSAKVAGVAIKGFSKVLKLAFSAGILIVLDLLIEGLMKLVDSFNKVDEEAERLKETQNELAEAYGNAQGKLVKYKTIVDNFNGSKKQEKKLVEELNREFGETLGTYKSLSEWQDVLKKKGDAYIKTLVNQAKAQAALNEVTAAYMNLEKVKQDKSEGKYSHWYQSQQQDVEAAARAIEKAEERIAKAEENLKKVVEENEKFAKDNGLGDFSPQIDKNGKKSADAAKKAQEDITKKQIEAMQDGLNKTLMQLTEEERQTINKIKENGVKVQQLVKQTEETYAQLRLKAINDYLQKLTKTVEDSAKKIAGIKFQLNTKDIELQINEIEEQIRYMTEEIVPINNTLTTKIEYEAQTKGINKDDLFFANAFNYQRNKANTEEEIKEYYKWLDEYVSTLSEDIKNKLSYMNLGTGELEIDYLEVEKYISEHYKRELQILSSYGYLENESLSESFAFRLNALRKYNEEYINEINKSLDKEYNLRLDAAIKERDNLFKENDENYRIETNALNKRLFDIKESLAAIEKVKEKSDKKMSEKFKKANAEQIQQLEEENGLKIETYKQYYETLQKSLIKNQKKTNEQIEEIDIIHGEKMQQILTESGQKIIEIENDINDKRQRNSESYYNKQISNYRDFLSKINDEASKQPVVDTAGFGIVNIVQTKRNYREILDASRTTLLNIKADREKLDESFKYGLISPENYNAILNQLDDLENETLKTFLTVVLNYKKTNGDFFQSIQMYIQEVLSSFNTIMNAVWDAQDVAFDKEQEEIDKWNDALQNALDKQEEMISEHKNKVDSIEDELANSRGDRRQHLIDQLNAEIAAEKAAEKEKQRIEKQQEANKRKQEQLDLKRQKAQWHRQIIQAIVNGAQAVTMAAINTWPIPAIPMMSLAAATTAAQIAIMQANKPYAKGGQLDGGVAVGNRHRDGGIKVLGGRAEIEGGEFITNRISTQMNAPLLEFINSKKKRIDISDMIDFYSSGSVKKNIANVRTKFEDGGYMPTLPNALDVRDQLQNIIINQDNRPIYVSVVDINNKQEEVRKVQTLAGL